ncbi:UNVERIFIED_ORG: septal ring factor EnvC (AmiA/AmiB activator) [Arthrobacter sp. UYCu721]
MSSFDDLLGQYEQPSEVDISLPGRVGAAGDKGGANNTAANATAPVDSPAESQAASTAPEPEPELPEGSDAEEKAAAEEEQAAAEAEAVQAAQQAEAAAEAEAAAAEEPDEDITDTDPDTSEPEDVQQEALYPVISRKGAGLNFKGETSQLKYFPKALIEQMREILKPRLGEAFARDLSQNSVVTALAIAALGVEFETDENTAQAVQAFRANDPRTDAIEKRTATLLEQQAKSDAMLKKISEKLGEVADTAAVLEMGQAYALAERTAHLDTEGALPETIDVTQKRAVASRDNIRKRVKTQQREEKVRAGRPIR